MHVLCMFKKHIASVAVILWTDGLCEGKLVLIIFSERFYSFIVLHLYYCSIFHFIFPIFYSRYLEGCVINKLNINKLWSSLSCNGMSREKLYLPSVFLTLKTIFTKLALCSFTCSSCHFQVPSLQVIFFCAFC